MKTPLAWHNLTHDRKRLLTAVGGIGFAVLLMFMQLGFRGALFDSTVLVAQHLQADLVIIKHDRYTLTVFTRFPQSYLRLAEAVPAVAEALPLKIENQQSTWKQPGRAVGPPIRVLAFDPSHDVLDLPEVSSQAGKLVEPLTALFDRRSKGVYGEVFQGEVIELGGRRVEIVGEFSLGTDFADDGTLIIGNNTFEALFGGFAPPGIPLGGIDIGVVKLRPGSDAEAAREAVEAVLPDDVVVLTKQQYVDQERSFWAAATPIGYVFTIGTIMGFIVGMTICYQILFADIADHLREFATLKAMGYRASYFIRVVLEEALLLAPIGFVPGLIAAVGLYATVGAATGLPMHLPASRIVGVLGLTVLMCVLSGCLTMRQVLTAEPAELFV